MKNNIHPDGFREVPPGEQKEINGGIVAFLVGIGIAAVAEIFHDWDNFKNGLMGRPEEKVIHPQ